MGASLPLEARAVDGAWRQRPPEPGDSERLVALLAAGAVVPEGFRLGRVSPIAVSGGERRIEVDQTNSSWVVGESVVVKWTTEPLVGPQPAAERLRRLDDAGFRATPRLRALVEWATPEGHWVPAVVVSDLVPDATDGWTWCLHEARVELGLRDGPAQPFARAVGELAAAMHLALADSPSGPVADHGDFHVGQLLRTPAGDLVVIDFDGNPTLTPAERAAHRPAAYDVAGMLVSLENVGHVVAHYDPQVADAEVVAWTERVQGDFLDAYREAADALLDISLLEPLMLDQIRRELAYADSHLPRWRYVPEAALRRRGLL